MAVRFGLLGTGRWARETHGASLANHQAVSFVGVWGRDPVKTAALADRYRVKAYDATDDLLADVDAVAIALPPDIQVGLALRAAAAGKHLLLDKPMSLTKATADQLVAVVERRQVASLVFFTHRYYSHVRAYLRQLSDAGPWGGASVTWFTSIFGPGSPYADSTWRKEKGGLWDLGPHALSILLPVLGPVRQVAALTAADNTNHVFLGHRSGAVSRLSLAIDAAAASTTREFLFYGRNGITSMPERDAEPVRAFSCALSELVRCIGEGERHHVCDVRFGRDVVAILEAAETAGRQGRHVHLDQQVVERPAGEDHRSG